MAHLAYGDKTVDAPAGINITGSCATTLPTLMAKTRQSAPKFGQRIGKAAALAPAFLGRVSTLRDTFLAKNPGRGL